MDFSVCSCETGTAHGYLSHGDASTIYVLVDGWSIEKSPSPNIAQEMLAMPMKEEEDRR